MEDNSIVDLSKLTNIDYHAAKGTFAKEQETIKIEKQNSSEASGAG